MKFDALSLQGAWLISPEPHADTRGSFARLFCRDEFAQQGLCSEFAQHSVSCNTRKATLRGLHYQDAPHAETKLVRCSRGSIYDVVVDIRKTSSTFGKWLGFELSADNNLALYIPEGFAHGFVTLLDNSDVQYMIDKPHVSNHGKSICWNDPDLAINWPVQPQVISDQDNAAQQMKYVL